MITKSIRKRGMASSVNPYGNTILKEAKYRFFIVSVSHRYRLFSIHIEYFSKIEMVFWRKRKKSLLSIFLFQFIVLVINWILTNIWSKSEILYRFTDFINLICKIWILSFNSTLFSSKDNKQSFVQNRTSECKTFSN